MSPRPAGSARRRADGRLVVLQSFRALAPTSNPYLSQLVAALPSAIRTRTFDWTFALTGAYDVFHVQWPELLVRGRDRRRTVARRALFALLLLVLRARRVAVVRTAHNLAPHDAGGRIERLLLQRLDRMTTVWVTLTDSTPLPAVDRRRTIPHGHYRDWFAGQQRPASVPGRLLFFGLVRRYKGVESLVQAFTAVPDPELTLHIVGKPDPAALGNQIAAAAASDLRISAHLAYLPDEQLAREIGESELVVLPYTEIHNSGSVLLALSLDRPVLVPEAPTTRALQQEAGPEWVQLFRPPLSPEAVVDAVARLRTQSHAGRPDLSARDWPALGEQFATVYREAAAVVGRRRYSV